jgi:hypothetical protein
MVATRRTVSTEMRRVVPFIISKSADRLIALFDSRATRAMLQPGRFWMPFR